MTQHLPPLSSLRAFEAAARLESFSRAADEIHVTHGAVSHQVKALEEFLDVTLFRRESRRVALTDDGRFFAERVRSALNQIGEAAGFASRWLMPRIGRFMALHPGLEVQVEATASLTNFARDGVDVAIRFGRGPWSGVHAEKFMDDAYVMVCSPKLNRGRLPKRPEDLARFPLLRTLREEWDLWCKAAGIDLPPPTGGVEFDDAAMMLHQVVEGHGISLARRSIAEGDIARGTLVQLFDITVPSQHSYYMVWPENITPSDKILAFREWLLKEKRRRQ
jgi:LysR family transcriptional regulator, glycine cleavage system transcriptional activator